MDKHLEDDWLTRLNKLQALSLISICEGHSGHQSEAPKTYPHIKLRLKEHLLPGIASRWDQQKLAAISEVNKLFQTGGTYVNLELKFKLRSATGRLTYQEELIIRIHSRRGRTSEEMDAETREWFQHTVGRVEELDRFVAEL